MGTTSATPYIGSTHIISWRLTPLPSLGMMAKPMGMAWGTVGISWGTVSIAWGIGGHGMGHQWAWHGASVGMAWGMVAMAWGIGGTTLGLAGGHHGTVVGQSNAPTSFVTNSWGTM